jgi:hypothetical protein
MQRTVIKARPSFYGSAHAAARAEPRGGGPKQVQLGTRQLAVLLGLMLSTVAGCGMLRKPFLDTQAAGELAARSLSNPDTTLKGGFDSAFYSFDGSNRMTVVMYSGPLENPSQAVTIRMFWRPRAGRTPIASTATNATVNYVVFSGADNRSVGIYSGAGFLYPRSKPGSARLSASLWQATLSLKEHDAAFQDLLGAATLAGSFKAQHDRVAVNRTVRRLNQHVRQRLGYPRMVRADAP